MSNTLLSGNKIFTPLLRLIFHLLSSIREKDVNFRFISFSFINLNITLAFLLEFFPIKIGRLNKLGVIFASTKLLNSSIR